MSDDIDDAEVIAATQRWLERAVIGLNLCPFAKATVAKRSVRIAVSHATSQEALAEDLQRELQVLAAAPIDELETTLIVHPGVLRDFFEYNDFLDVADALLADLDLEGVVQVASFHPDYCFADAPADDPANYTNRSPYPTLHLLREASIDRAVAAVPDTDRIYERNIETLRNLGVAGFEAVLAGTRKPGES
jgi:hypothetical protein